MALLTVLSGCDADPADELHGYYDIEMEFWATTLDEQGNALPGVTISGYLEQYGKAPRLGTDFLRPSFKWTSDDRGRLYVKVVGKGFRIRSVTKQGYTEFNDNLGIFPPNHFFPYITGNNVEFEPAKENPAVFVLVREGALQVTAMPSKGGYQISGGLRQKNEPYWPKYAKASDIPPYARFGPPTAWPATQPTSDPTTRPDGGI